MAYRLGEILVNEKLITTSQLDEALEYQALYGGKIGIILIEMGFVREEDIARMLSRKFELPFIKPERLKHIPAEVIAQIPSTIAARHSIVPIAMNGETLTVAMANPTDLEVIEEIAFRTGLETFPVVTPELSLSHALKKYYKVERQLRPVPERMVANQILNGQTSHGIHPPQVEPGIKKKADSHLKLVRKSAETSMQSGSAGILTFKEASVGLVNTTSRHDVAAILIHFASQVFKRTALFTVQGKSSWGWVANVEGTMVENFDKVQIPLDDASILRTVVDSKKLLVGPIPFSPLNARIISSFGGPSQQSAGLLPITIGGRVVAVLYVDGERANLTGNFVELQQLVAKAAMALEILILKNKIVTL
ncbi:MAG: hypothetical protein JXK94_15250 [Deltaproteobacteria bacterium]|nr:hypothetical protein [Deltaproteobacteria bacterium]